MSSALKKLSIAAVILQQRGGGNFFVALLPWLIIFGIVFLLIKRPPWSKPLLAVIAGFILGGFIGFALRPSAPLIGQLPFDAVITQGANLRGLDTILVSTAQASFNYMLIGAIIGGIGGFVGWRAFAKKGINPSTIPTLQNEDQKVSSKIVGLGDSPEQVEFVLGQPEKMVNLGSKVIYVYKDIKVTFLEGKVTDVQ